jgi:hypothetical protein
VDEAGVGGALEDGQEGEREEDLRDDVDLHVVVWAWLVASEGRGRCWRWSKGRGGI